MSKLLTVFGATGQQGGSLITYVLNHPTLSKLYHLRGITRDTSKKASLDLKNLGVEIIQADLNDPPSLIPAVSGSYAVFGVTNCCPLSFTIPPHYPLAAVNLTSNTASHSLGLRLRTHRNRPRKSHSRRLPIHLRSPPNLVFPPQPLFTHLRHPEIHSPFRQQSRCRNIYPHSPNPECFLYGRLVYAESLGLYAPENRSFPP
jgi:hypothetical protein